MAIDKPFALRVAGTTISVVASVLLSLHVLFLHAKLVESEKADESGKVVLNAREAVERWFIIGATILYLIGFALILAAAILERRKKEL